MKTSITDRPRRRDILYTLEEHGTCRRERKKERQRNREREKDGKETQSEYLSAESVVAIGKKNTRYSWWEILERIQHKYCPRPNGVLDLTA